MHGLLGLALLGTVIFALWIYVKNQEPPDGYA